MLIKLQKHVPRAFYLRSRDLRLHHHAPYDEVRRCRKTRVEFSYIHTVLEVFVLYSITTTSDFSWMRNNRAAYIGRQTEIMSEITFFLSQMPSPLDADSSEGCLWLAALREKISRREHCRSEIIRMIVELANTLPLDLPFVTYSHEKSIPPAQCRQICKKVKTYRVSLDCHGLLPCNRVQGLRSSSSIRR